jgi:hypothetical protein
VQVTFDLSVPKTTASLATTVVVKVVVDAVEVSPDLPPNSIK